MDQLFQFGLQGVVAYGVVGLISYIAKRKNQSIDPQVKLYMLISVCFAVGFVPVDLGNILFNRLKEAAYIGFAINAMNTIANKIGGE